MNQPEKDIQPESQDSSQSEESSPLTQDADEALELNEEQAAQAENAPSQEALLAEENAQLKDQLLRSMAELENVRKRAQRDVEESNKYAVTGFARNMVGVIETMQRACESIPENLRNENEHVKNLAMGVEMTMNEMLGIFARHGIERIAPEKGEKFDHNLHQAMAQIEDPEAEPGSILQVMQAGYKIHDRLLQPAMVGVAKRGTAPAQQVDTEA